MYKLLSFLYIWKLMCIDKWISFTYIRIDTINYLRDIFIYMKFIITENKRNQIVTDWLDKNYGNLKPEQHKIASVTSYVDDNGDEVFSYDWYGLVTIHNSDLQTMLFTVFNLDKDSLNSIFIPWMMERYYIKVNDVRYTTWHCNKCGEFHPTKYHID